MRGLNFIRPLSGTKTMRKAQPPSARLQIESLEERVLLDNKLSGLINALDARLAGIDSTLRPIISASSTALPILNKPLSTVTEVLDTVKRFRPTIVNTLRNLSDDQLANGLAQNAIQNVLYAALGGAGVLGDTNGSGGITMDDVQVTGVDLDAGNVTVEVRLTGAVTVINQPFTFGLGLPGIPFQIDSKGELQVSASFDYHNLKFGLNNGTFFLDTSAADQFKVSVDASLKNASISGILGFLVATATTQNAPGPTNLHADVTFDVGNSGLANPRLGGGADVNLKLAAKFSDAADAPKISADFFMHWGLGGSDPRATAAGFGQAPTVEFRNVSLDLGSFLSSVMRPIVDTVETAITPIQPVLSLLNWKLPGLSDLSESVGLGEVSLLTLAKVAKSTGAVPEDWKLVIQLVDTLSKLDNLIGLFQPGNNSLAINVGTLKLANSGDLRTLPALGSINDLKSLIGNGQNLTTLIPDLVNKLPIDEIRKQINNSSLPTIAKGAANNILDYVNSFKNNISLTFPLLDDPVAGVFKLMLGQDVDFVHFKSEFHIPRITQSQQFPLWGPVNTVFTGDIKLDSVINLGYDTFGLRQIFKTGEVSHLVDGLYIQKDPTQPLLRFDGGIAAGVELDFPPVYYFAVPPTPFTPFPVPVPVTPAIELTGGVRVEGLFIDVVDVTGDGKRRLLANTNGRLFETHGKLTGDFTGKVVAHTPLFFLPDVVLYKKEFAKKELINLDDDPKYGDNPFIPSVKLPPAPLNTDLSLLPDGNDGKPDSIVYSVNQGYVVCTVNGRELSRKPYADVSTINLRGSTDDDIVTVRGNVSKTINVNGGAGINSLTLDDVTAGAPAGTYKVSEANLWRRTFFTPAAADEVSINYDLIDHVTLATTGGDISVNGLYDGVTLDLNLGSRNHTINVGALSGTLDSVQGTVAMHGTGSNYLTLSDQNKTWDAANVAPRYLITDTSVTRLDDLRLFLPSGEVVNLGTNIATFNYDNASIRGLTINGGHGGDNGAAGSRFFVLSTTDQTPVTLNGSAGSDLFVAGTRYDAAYGMVTMNDLRGPVTIHGGRGEKDQFVINDTATENSGTGALFTSNQLTYTITDRNVQRVNKVSTKLFGVETVASSITCDGIEDFQIYGANSPSVYNVQSTPVGSVDINLPSAIFRPASFAIHAGTADDTVILGAGTNSVDNLRGALSVDDSGGSDQLLVNDQANPYVDTGSNPGMLFSLPGARGYSIDMEVTAAGVEQTSITAGSTFVVADNGGFESITLNTGNRADFIYVPSTPAEASVTVNAGGGDDTIQVGGFRLDGIHGSLTVNGGDGNDKLSVEDLAAAAAQTYTLTATTLNRSGAAPITYGSVESLAIYGTGYDDLFTVTSTAAGIPVTIHGERGDDTVVVGNNTDGVDDILSSTLSPVLFDGGPGTDSLTVNDQANPYVKGLFAGKRTYSILSNDRGNSIQAGTASIQYLDGLENLTLNTGNRTNEIDVFGTQVHAVTTVNAGSGDNTFRVTSLSNNAQENILGALTLNGDTGTNQFLIDDTLSSVGPSYNITDTTVTRAGAAPITYSNMSALQITGGQAVKTFSVASTAPGMTVTLNGSAGKKNTLQGSDAANTWQITGANAGTLSGDALASPVTFSGFANLVGGADQDTFLFMAPGQGLSGSLDGGAGKNTLDYTAYTTNVVVNLQLGAATDVAGTIANIQDVTGGGGPGYNILVGNGGNVLTGGNGRNLLIAGGTGSTLIGGTDEDILIGGTTTLDTNAAALLAIMAEWTRTDLGYLDRVDHILNGGGLNAGNVLNATTVTGNKAGNTLTGGPGLDLFFGDLNLDTTDYDAANEMFIVV
jgi:hypothetical protein